MRRGGGQRVFVSTRLFIYLLFIRSVTVSNLFCMVMFIIFKNTRIKLRIITKLSHHLLLQNQK